MIYWKRLVQDKRCWYCEVRICIYCFLGLHLKNCIFSIFNSSEELNMALTEVWLCLNHCFFQHVNIKWHEFSGTHWSATFNIFAALRLFQNYLLLLKIAFLCLITDVSILLQKIIFQPLKTCQITLNFWYCYKLRSSPWKMLFLNFAIKRETFDFGRALGNTCGSAHF